MGEHVETIRFNVLYYRKLVANRFKYTVYVKSGVSTGHSSFPSWILRPMVLSVFECLPVVAQSGSETTTLNGQSTSWP